MIDVVYFSTTSENTKRFVGKLELDPGAVHRIPLYKSDEPLIVDKPFVLVIPSYGGEVGERPVLPQIIRFLNNEENRQFLSGVICCGNTNFGKTFCKAGYEVSAKCDVPLLAKIEIFGTPEQVCEVKDLLKQL